MSGYADPGEQMGVYLYVGNIRESRESFRSLGFEMVKEQRNFAELRWAHALLFLEEAIEAPSPPTSLVGNVRIPVPNVDHYRILSQKLRIPVLRSIENRHYGLRGFTIAGPDGLGPRLATRMSYVDNK